MPVSHAYTSAIPDGGDATLVQPSNWNAAHVANINLASEVTGTLPAGNLPTDVMYTDIAQQVTRQKYYPSQSTSGTWDWNLGRNFTATGSGGAAIAMSVPNNLQIGTAFIRVAQSATGGEKLTFASGTFKAGASIPFIVGNANGWILYSFYYDGTNIYYEAKDY